MLYTYDKGDLSYRKVPFKIFVYPILIIGSIIAIFFKVAVHNAEQRGFIDGTSIPFEEGFYAIESSEQVFSQQALVEELKRLNVRFPEIILAQSILETGHYTSRIFEENNNLFGMKEAKARSTTALGTQLGHAYYNNWKESVLDYALFQNAYMNKIRKEKQYLKYLDKNYAEATGYDKTILKVIEKENLKELFLE
jgi:hypothetical protein